MFDLPKNAGTPVRTFVSTASLLFSISAALLLVSSPAYGQTAAGRTAGAFAVSPTGAATYTIPIWAPPGPKGLQPNIALTYSSQQGNGYLGMGWNLSGLSIIYRCNLTTAQDGAPAPVALVAGDGYCLDGQRLFLTAGTYGAGGSTYQTEVANFITVTAYSQSGVTGIGYWTATDRNGRTYTYGNGGNSQVLAGTTQTAWEWALNEVSDPYGNTMTVSYSTTNALNAVVPALISWTPVSQGSGTYSYTMTFGYNSSNATFRYVAGVPVTNANLLASISIQYNGTTVKVYGLSYQASATTGREEISQIQECSTWGNSSCLEPTLISYQLGTVNNEGTANNATTTPITTAKTVYAHYDFNHDGYPDLLFSDGTYWYVSFGSASGYGTPVRTGLGASTTILPGDLLGNGYDGILADVGGTWYYYTWNGSQFTQGSAGPQYDSSASQYVLADVNGDGLPDLVKLNWTSGGLTVYVYLNNGSGNSVSFAPPTAAYSLSAGGAGGCSMTAAQIAANSDQTYTLGTLRFFDFNGDGRQDLVLQTTVTHSNNGNQCTAPFTSDPLTYELISTSTSTTASFTGTVIALDVASVAFLNWNSDGCTDVYSAGYIYIAGCNGSTPSTIAVPGTVIGAMDWNGDGLTDLLVVDGNQVGVYLSTGDGLAGTEIQTGISYTNTTTYFTFDANGDGLDDLGYVTSSGIVGYYLHNAAGQMPDLLSTVTDGYGNSASPTYVSLVGSSNYTLGTSGTYPYQNYVGSIYVVNQATFSDPSSSTGATYYQTYQYWYAETNLEGRGFAGFGINQTWDSRNSLADDQYYLQTFPYTGMLYKDLLFNSLGNLRQSVGTPTTSDVGATGYPQRYFPWFTNWTTEKWELVVPLSQQEPGDTEGGDVISTTSTNYSYDNYGNPTSIATTVTDNDPGSNWEGDTWTTTTANQWNESTPSCPSLLSTSTITYSASNGSTQVQIQKNYTPNTTDCNYTQIVTQPNSSLQVTEALGYDNFGNINSDAVTGAGMGTASPATRTTTANWGTTGQFPAWIKDPSGAETQFSYNLSYGTLSTLTDQNSTAQNPIVTTWVPDAFGRVHQETRPDGTYTTWTYTNCAGTTGCLVGTNGLNIAFSAYGSNSALITSGATYTDPVGRTLVTLTTMLSGSSARIDTQYDQLGNVHQRSFPCTYSSFSTTCTHWTTNTYDALNRLTLSQRPENMGNLNVTESTSYGYAGVHTTITDPLGHAKILMTDVNGWQRQTTDAYGYTITTQYDAAGNPTGVVDNSNNRFLTEAYTYGLRAFPATVTDADRGTWTYTYDALGELTNWQDANGNAFTEYYDSLSRPYKRWEKDLFTQWTWGSSPASDNVGKLQSVCTGTGTNPQACTPSPGYSESETYDSLSRLSQRAITLPGTYGATYTYGFAYNTAGQLGVLTYPASYPSSWGPLQIQYNYTNGTLQSIQDITSSTNTCGTTCTVWTATATDPMGHVTGETLGNGITTTRVYDAITGWLTSAQSANGGNTVSSLAFSYDPMGNVTLRQDLKQNLNETLCYDNDYRLVQAYASLGTCSGTQTLQVGYASNGNITSRSDVAGGATWTYGTTNNGTTQPHAVSQAGSGAYAYGYDANGNATSRQGSSITYSSYNYPTTINAGSGSTAESVTLSYGPERQRWQQFYSGNSTTENTNYAGGLFEAVTAGSVTTFRHYISVGTEHLAVYSRSSGGDTYYYLLSDHQGSVASITNSSGSQVVGESFTPFGNRRSPSTWSGPDTTGDLTTIAEITRQGYTFQTAMGLWMGINHMNGRIQDSITGRFLSADPHITDPTNTQDYDRFSYVDNNPLTEVDPSGFLNGSIDSCAQLMEHNPFTSCYNYGGGLDGTKWYSTDGNHSPVPIDAYWLFDPVQDPGTAVLQCIAGGDPGCTFFYNPGLVSAPFSLTESPPSGLTLGGTGTGGARQGKHTPIGYQKNAAFLQCMADRIGALGFALDQINSLFGIDSNFQQAFSQDVYDIEAGGAVNMVVGTILAGGRKGLGGSVAPRGMLWGSQIGEFLAGTGGAEIGAFLGQAASTGTALSGSFAGSYLATTAAICFYQTQ